MKKTYNILLLCAGLSAFPSLASDVSGEEFSQEQATQEHSKQALRDTIAKAITHYEQSPRKLWSYRVSNYENEEGDISSSIEQFDPSLPKRQQWTLLSINGETPSPKQQQKFVDKKHKENKKNTDVQNEEENQEGQNIRLQFRELIQLETLERASETDDKLKANFKVSLEKLGKKASKKLQGQLTYDKNEQFIEHIVITNTASFSPVFSAKITDFKITFNFSKLNDSILPKEYELSMKGTFAFFTEIEEVSTNTFSDYRFVGE